MGWDQIHERNNKLIKGCGGASNLLNKVEDSALIRWETWSPEIALVILGFKDYLHRNEIYSESSNKHHEDSLSFHQQLSSDVCRLVKRITVNPFTQDHLTKLNKKVVVPETLRTVTDDQEVMGEQQLETFASDQLVVSKVPISKDFTLTHLSPFSHFYTP